MVAYILIGILFFGWAIVELKHNAKYTRQDIELQELKNKLNNVIESYNHKLAEAENLVDRYFELIKNPKYQTFDILLESNTGRVEIIGNKKYHNASTGLVDLNIPNNRIYLLPYNAVPSKGDNQMTLDEFQAQLDKELLQQAKGR